MSTLNVTDWLVVLGGLLSAWGVGWIFGRGWKMIRQFTDQI